MKAVKNKVRVTKGGMKVTESPTLNKYSNVILAPKKVEEDKSIVRKIDFAEVRRLIANSK